MRENFKNNRTEAIWENLRLELDKEYTPLQNLMQEVITSDMDFESAVDRLSKTKVNAPGYIILMNAKPADRQGVVLTRNRDDVEKVQYLDNDSPFYIVQTNMDWWE